MRWEGGELVSGSGARYRRPADFAAAESVLLPFPEVTRESIPPSFTAAGAAAAGLFFDGAGERTVLRGEVGEFIVFARREGRGWRVGAVAREEMSLTVRLEDLWERLPEAERVLRYEVAVLRDPLVSDAVAAGSAVRETIADVAPDARIFLDLAAGGGFVLQIMPEND